MSEVSSNLRHRRGEGVDPSDKSSSTAGRATKSEIEPVETGDDGVEGDLTGKKDDSVIEDPLKDVKEGIYQAPCSKEFWIMIITVLCCIAGSQYLQILKEQPPYRVLSKSELAKFDGSDGPIYLSILGQVFDVTQGRKYYGENGGYSFFTGRDASRAFITGDFLNNLSEDISDFTADQFKGLVEWRDFYVESKDYQFVGVLDGQFYDSKGMPTGALKQAEDGALEGKKVQELREAEKKKFPNCNSRWSQKTGGEVWCVDGYPRRIIDNIPGAKPTPRCACFQEMDHSDARKLYDECQPEEKKCRIKKEKQSPQVDTDRVESSSETKAEETLAQDIINS